MSIQQDPRPEYLPALEGLLHGQNYDVWLNLYGPLDAGQPLEQALCQALAHPCDVGGSTPESVQEAREQVLEALLYPGDPSHGPLDLDRKTGEILELGERLIEAAHLDQADAVRSFWLAQGHPAWPVFWEFAYDIQVRDQRWLLLGSSSD
ncbi:MAG: hypothetical protein GAK43_02531 [Stenotrophomonas maltophilia]|nr:MAG: hypothetical protein GAK43_02531 [Stenotrophomonas maltophilia]